jgi:hypothetical protein
MAASRKSTTEPKNRRPPARTPEGRENQLIEAAVELAEKQLSDGTASAQVITHFLKLATTRERLEKEKLARENELLKAKTEALQSVKHIEELYENAIVAMREYGGNKEEEEIDDPQD